MGTTFIYLSVNKQLLCKADVQPLDVLPSDLLASCTQFFF